jgi:chemotaxis protein CheX
MSMTKTSFAGKDAYEAWPPLLGLAAREVFESMLGSHLELCPESVSEDDLDITSMVGLAGQICGIMTLRCTTIAATMMAAKMLGVKPADAGPEMYDAVGEVCNMIAGNFKNKIAGIDDATMLSVPTVITGADYSLRALTDSGKIEVHLLFEGRPMLVCLEVHS